MRAGITTNAASAGTSSARGKTADCIAASSCFLYDCFQLALNRGLVLSYQGGYARWTKKKKKQTNGARFLTLTNPQCDVCQTVVGYDWIIYADALHVNVSVSDDCAPIRAMSGLNICFPLNLPAANPQSTVIGSFVRDAYDDVIVLCSTLWCLEIIFIEDVLRRLRGCCGAVHFGITREYPFSSYEFQLVTSARDVGDDGTIFVVARKFISLRPAKCSVRCTYSLGSHYAIYEIKRMISLYYTHCFTLSVLLFL